MIYCTMVNNECQMMELIRFEIIEFEMCKYDNK